ATGNNSYKRVASRTFTDGFSGLGPNAVARVNVSGPAELFWSIAPGLLRYKAVAPGQWTLSSIITGATGYVFARDLNRNGRDEIYWFSFGTLSSVVLERPTLPSDVGPTNSSFSSLRIVPSPCQGNGTVFLGPEAMSRGRELEVFDASGRRVRSERWG